MTEDELFAVRALVSSVEKLKYLMEKGHDGRYQADGRIRLWDEGIPTICHLEINLERVKAQIQEAPKP